MALGYTIAAILKRSSHVFSDDRVSVKIDWLEQLNRKYVQVSTDYFIRLFKLIWGLLHYLHSLLVSGPFVLFPMIMQ